MTQNPIASVVRTDSPPTLKYPAGTLFMKDGTYELPNGTIKRISDDAVLGAAQPYPTARDTLSVRRAPTWHA